MDKWNRNDPNEYTGITAQRRNRRRLSGDGAEKTAVPEAPEEAVTAAEPADRSAYMRPEAPENELPAAGAAEPEESAEPEGKDPAETEKAAGEELPAVRQDADSRVPPEARRMAAAPYGEGGSAHRETAQRAVSGQAAPGSNRVVIHQRRPSPAGESLTSAQRASQARPERRPEERVRVGYAPGRMSEDMTQQIPAREAMKESIYGRDAKTYLEQRRHPFRAESDNRQVPDRPGHKVLRAVTVLLILAGFVLTGWMILKNRDKNEPVITREAPQVISFEVPEGTENMIAPVDLTFSAVTEKDVEGIRLNAEGDGDLKTEVYCGDNADGKVWMIKTQIATGFTGRVVLQVRRSEKEDWYDTEYTADLNVSSPIIPEGQTAENTGTAEKPENEQPTDDGKTDPEEEPGREPGEEPDGEPDGEPGEDPDGEPDTETETGMTPEDSDAIEAEEEELPAGELKTAEPTFTPAPATPEPTEVPPLTAEAAPEADPGLITATTVYTSYTKKEKSYNRPAKELIHMPEADEYTNTRLGVMTFRGDNFRRNAAAGALSAAPLELTVRWQTESGSVRGANQTYYGYGWTGQAAIARWSTEVRTHSNITESKIVEGALKEVIIAGLDGSIRFLDLNDGKITRNSIKLGYPMRGTPSLHTRGYPFLSVGQAARKMKTKTGKIGVRQYNLFNQNELKLLDGLDGKYHRPLNNVGSFETSALVDRTSDTLITVGTNGMLYLEALNTTFDYNTGVMTVAPAVTVMNSKAKGQKNTALMAVESSPAAYDKYVFYADMGGVLRCVDTNTLSPVWAVETGDSVMAAIAMDMTRERQLNLYTANMLNNRKKGNSDIQIRQYDAMSGREKWCTEIGVYKGKKDKTDVGAKASPVIGQHSLDSLVYYTVTGLSEAGRAQLSVSAGDEAALIALEKETGRIAWAFGLGSRSESSPIALYDKEGNGWIFQCEQNGMIHLLDGLNGQEICSLKLEAEIEASPAAYNNVVVIGTTGKGTSFVYGIEVRLDKQNEDEPEQPQENSAEEPEEDEAEEAEEEQPEDEEGETGDEEIYGGA